MARALPHTEAERARLRGWLEHVAQEAIDWLDQLDAASLELEDDEREIVTLDDTPRRHAS